jgi:muramoyltetrapeptide carboxypeptidase
MHKNISLNLSIIAPSGYSPEIKVQQSIINCQKIGINIINQDRVYQKFERFGGNDEQRQNDICFSNINNINNINNNINVIMPVRGGYGFSRLLDQVNWSNASDNIINKNLKVVGHSDFTLFHAALYAHSKIISYAGPMFTSDFSGDKNSEINKFMLDNFYKSMQGFDLSYDVQKINKINKNCASNIEGILWGGNLSMICSIIGTKYMPNINDGILFIEDINEHPYRVERMLHSLYHAGILQKQQALIFGDFSDFKLSQYDNGYTFESMLNYWINKLDKYNIAIFNNLKFGHCAEKACLPFGASATINITDMQTCLIIKNYV